MQRHYGGVQGTVFRRGKCPICGRDTAGGSANRERSMIWLKPHNRNRVSHESSRAALVRDACPGGGMVVPVDHNLTQAYGAAVRRKEARRRALWAARLA